MAYVSTSLNVLRNHRKLYVQPRFRHVDNISTDLNLVMNLVLKYGYENEFDYDVFQEKELYNMVN